LGGLGGNMGGLGGLGSLMGGLGAKSAPRNAESTASEGTTDSTFADLFSSSEAPGGDGQDMLLTMMLLMLLGKEDADQGLMLALMYIMM
jgi:hypothetical protein